MKAKAALPKMEKSAAEVRLAELGLSAMRTPTKPMAMAVQRRQPTFSPSRNGESAAT
ncbi:hypothetical protein D3C78_1249200 [compost metagenome]